MFTVYAPIDPSEPVSPGTIIAACGGDVLRHGILKADGSVIAQVPESLTIDVSRFKISELDLTAFVKGADSLLRCEDSCEYSYTDCLSRAEGVLGTLVEGVYSLLGDDFAYWSMTGNYVSPDSEIFGKHLVVPFYELGVLKAKHHAIGIENNWVVHFTDVEGEGKTKPLCGLRIQIRPYDEFSKEYVPTQYQYPSESVGDKVIARNRAVNCWALQGFGDYGLFTNNCEHFAMWCKTGVKESSQVRELLGNLTLATVGGLLMKRPHPGAITAINKIFKRHVKSLF